MKTTIIALSAAALIAAAPAVFAQGVPGKAPGLPLEVSKKHHPGIPRHAPRREVQAKVLKKGYPGTFGYAPSEVLDRETEITRQAGGGGGGGGGNGM